MDQFPTETVLKDGINIPKDSELLKDHDQATDISNQEALTKLNTLNLPISYDSPKSLPLRNQFLLHSLPLLDNISTQILRIIAIGPYEETLAIITNEESSDLTNNLKDLITLFQQIKLLYSDNEPFLTIKHVFDFNELMEQTNRDAAIVEFNKLIHDSIENVLKKSNLTTFLLATLGSIDVGFFHLNESFLDVFCPTNDRTHNGKLLKTQAKLFLELKTQAFISALDTNSTNSRSRSEILDDIFPNDLNEYLLKRRNCTQLTPSEIDFLSRCKLRKETLLNDDGTNLNEKYEWLIFLKELFSYVIKNLSSLINPKKNTAVSSSFSSHDILSPLINKPKLDSKKEKLSSSKGEAGASDTKATSTSTPSPAIRHILRRPWTKMEEQALTEGLKEFGPQWSRILEHFGAGGTRNEELKNRTQVQLKDKARNWKMSYLKNNQTLPDYLTKVTGELDDAGKRKKRKVGMSAVPEAPEPASQPPQPQQEPAESKQ